MEVGCAQEVPCGAKTLEDEQAGRASGARVLVADRMAAAEALLEDTAPPGRTH